jgi:hypothetical protein
MNNSTLASDPDLNPRCVICKIQKDKREFVKTKKRERVPLRELDDNVLREVKLVARCQECRDKRNGQGRKSNDLRKAKLAEVNNAKLDSYIKLSWEEAQRMVAEG